MTGVFKSSSSGDDMRLTPGSAPGAAADPMFPGEQQGFRAHSLSHSNYTRWHDVFPVEMSQI